jgi:hypothetical protein
MSLPEQDPSFAATTTVSAEDNGRPRYRWYHKTASVLAAIFCFELGVFLLVYPWASHWDVNYYRFLPTWARGVWASPYFRGAVSGLGLLNIYISLIEVIRLRRFSA